MQADPAFGDGTEWIKEVCNEGRQVMQTIRDNEATQLQYAVLLSELPKTTLTFHQLHNHDTGAAKSRGLGEVPSEAPRPRSSKVS